MLLISLALASPLAARAWVEDRKIVIRNDTAIELTKVVAVIDQTVMCDVGTVAADGEVAMPLEWCVGELPAAPARVEITTKQGSLLVPLKAPDRVHKLKLAAEVKGGRLIVHNEDGIALSACRVTVNGTWGFTLGDLAVDGGEGVFLVRLRDPQGKLMTDQTEPRVVHLECQEGAGTYVLE